MMTILVTILLALGQNNNKTKDIKLIDATNAEHDFIAHAYQDISKCLMKLDD